MIDAILSNRARLLRLGARPGEFALVLQQARNIVVAGGGMVRAARFLADRSGPFVEPSAPWLRRKRAR